LGKDESGNFGIAISKFQNWNYDQKLFKGCVAKPDEE
jgi:hypothetical protein